MGATDLCLVKLSAFLIGFRKTRLFSLSILSTEYKRGVGTHVRFPASCTMDIKNITSYRQVLFYSTSPVHEFVTTPTSETVAPRFVYNQNLYPEIQCVPRPKFTIPPIPVVPVLVKDATHFRNLHHPAVLPFVYKSYWSIFLKSFIPAIFSPSPLVWNGSSLSLHAWTPWLSPKCPPP